MDGLPSQNITNDTDFGFCKKEDSVDVRMYPIVYSLFFIVGFPANCLSFYIALVLAMRGNNLAVYLVNLSVSDLLYTITLPVWIWLSFRYTLSNTLCSLINFVMINSFYVGTSFLCCISMDRYLAVVYPLYYPWAHTVRTANTVSALVWLIEICLHLVLLHHTGALPSFSLVRLCEEKMPMKPAESDAALVRVAISFIAPLFLMTYCFLCIFTTLQRSTFAETSERRKIQSLLFLLLLTYLVAFAPYQTVMLLRSLWEPNSCSYALSIRDTFMVFVATTTINSVVDPILYCLLSAAARTEMNRLWQACRRRFGNIFLFQKITVPSISRSTDLPRTLNLARLHQT